MSLFDSTLKRLNIIAWIEGISYLVLLFVAMPMKYLADDPSLVRSVGMAHGVLFVLFTVVVYQAMNEYGWSRRRALRAWLTAFLPFGMILLDRIAEEA